MTKQDAIKILKALWASKYPEYSDDEIREALDMAIEALSNTPNTFNTLEALGITDKQINMAIGAIIHMLNIGYYSEDMEDALDSAIRVLAEAERGEGMMFFTERKELSDKAEQWMEENHVAKTPLSVISYLEATGWLKLDSNSTEVDRENDELSCSEKPNMSDTIYRQDAIDEIQRFYGYLDEDMINRIHIGLNRLPSAQPEQRWIPCSERLPEEYGEYRITWKTSYAPNRRFIGDCEYEVSSEWDIEHDRWKGQWLLADYVKAYPDVEVIAWKPLEEPYKGVDNE